MSDHPARPSRRAFLRMAAMGTAAIPIAAVVLPRSVRAQDLPHLDPSEPTAKALHYTHDAETARDNPAYKEGSKCANCQFYTGKDGDEWGPCMLFPGKSVHRDGWCASWAKKAG